MPAESKAQWRLMQAKAARGEITEKQAKDFRKGDYKKLPERVGKKDSKRKTRRSSKR